VFSKFGAATPWISGNCPTDRQITQSQERVLRNRIFVPSDPDHYIKESSNTLDFWELLYKIEPYKIERVEIERLTLL
jgi:hypothetical protein